MHVAITVIRERLSGEYDDDGMDWAASADAASSMRAGDPSRTEKRCRMATELDSIDLQKETSVT